MMLTERFADFIYRTKFEDLPGDIVSLAKERILDSVGAILAGAGNWACRDQFLAACKAQGLGAAATAGKLLGLTKGLKVRFSPACAWWRSRVPAQGTPCRNSPDTTERPPTNGFRFLPFSVILWDMIGL